MKSINVRSFANWIAATGDTVSLKMYHEALKPFMCSVPSEFIESVSAAEVDKQPSVGSFNGRAIMSWILSIGAAIEHVNTDGVRQSLLDIVSLFKLLDSRVNPGKPFASNFETEVVEPQSSQVQVTEVVVPSTTEDTIQAAVTADITQLSATEDSIPSSAVE